MTNESNSEELFERLQDAEDCDQLVTARALYEAILTKEPEQASLLVLAAGNLIELGDLVAAEGLLQRAEENIDQESEAALLSEKGNLARARGEFSIAERLYRDAHKLDSGNAENLLNAAAMSTALGEVSRAEYLLREAVKLEDEFHIDCLFNLAGHLVSQQRYDEARSFYETILSIEAEHDLAKEWLIDLDQLMTLDLSE